MPDYRVWELLAESYKRTKQRAEEKDIRHRLHKADISRARKSGDIYTFLEKMAMSEAAGTSVPEATAEYLRTELGHDPGRERLSASAAFLLERFRDSILLRYVRAVSLAKLGYTTDAYKLVNGARKRILAEIHESENSPSPLSGQEKVVAKKKQLLKKLDDLWVIVDHVSRQNMAWALDDEEAEEDASDLSGQQVPVPENDPQRQNVRRETQRLANLQERFESSDTLKEKLDIILEVTRVRGRPLPDYQPTFRMARSLFDEISTIFRALAVSQDQDKKDHSLVSAREVPLLIRMYRLADRLEMPEIVSGVHFQLSSIAKSTENYETILNILGAVHTALPSADAKRVIREILTHDPSKRRATKALQWCGSAREADFAQEIFANFSEDIKDDKSIAARMSIFHEWNGHFDAARESVLGDADALINNPAALLPQKHWRLAIERGGELDFARASAAYLQTFPQPSKPEGIIFVSPRKLSFLRADPLVMLMELRKKGWAVVPLVEGTLPADETGIAEVDNLINIVGRDGRLKRSLGAAGNIDKDFRCDLANGHLSFRDVDLSHPMYELATVRRRAYTIDFSCPVVRGHLAPITVWVQSYLSVLEYLRHFNRSSKLRLGFMCGETHILPNAVFRHYCEKHGDPREFFCVQSVNAYENYFSNFKANVSTRLAVRNLTAVPHLRTPFLPEPSEFDAWYQANKDRAPEFLQEVEGITGMRRSTGDSAREAEAEACLQRIDKWRACGGKVVCLFGKVPADLAIPYDGGPAHSSMKDWLNHSIAAARAAPDTLLLIKPHPHELKVEIGLFLTEFFTDLIDEDLPDNVIVLGHRWFDMNDMKGRVDLGVLYNGTTAVELGTMGIPAVLCNDFGPTDYPVGHAVPRDREHYEQLITFECSAEVAPDLKERSAAWLKYLSSDEVSVPYRYYSRQVTNKVIHPPWWFEEDIARYLEQGDPHVEKLAREVTHGYLRS